MPGDAQIAPTMTMEQGACHQPESACSGPPLFQPDAAPEFFQLLLISMNSVETAAA
jgi:hypothetical protein